MRNEILKPVFDTDRVAVPRYDIVSPNGIVVRQNVELRLKNEIVQQGTPYDEESVLPASLREQLALPPSATPAEALAAIYKAAAIVVRVTAPGCSTVVATNGTQQVTASESAGVWCFYIPTYGDWTFTATSGSYNTTREVTMSLLESKLYEITIDCRNCWCVMWDSSSTSTELTRVNPKDDPLGLCTVTVPTEPVAGVGTSTGTSPFDSYTPFSKMREWNVVNQAITSKRGDPAFSRGLDTVVFVPYFWYRVYQAGTKTYYYLADVAGMPGMQLHPGSGKCIGKYKTSSGYVSTTGAAPLVNVTRAAARAGSRAKGSKWCQNYFAVYSAVCWLYLIEFADWNSQACIGRGYVDGNSDAINTGGCDAMTYHTGRAAGTDGKTAVQYRGIENLWGNVWEWVDGANFQARAMHECHDPAKFADDTVTGYTDVGLSLPDSTGYISKLGVSNAVPWAMPIPVEATGSATTKIPDIVSSGTERRVLRTGGYWESATNAGLFGFNTSFYPANSGINVGSRLCYLPTNAEIATMQA